MALFTPSGFYFHEYQPYTPASVPLAHPPFTSYSMVRPTIVAGSDHHVHHGHHAMDLPFPHARDHNATQTVGADGNSFTYKLDTSGYMPSELKVDVEGKEILVRAVHKQISRAGESVERGFVRRISIPDGIAMDTIRSSIDESGQLTVCGTKTPLEQNHKRTVHLEYKPHWHY